MIWFFERGDERLRYEVRRRGLSYEISVRRSNGRDIVRLAHTASHLVEQAHAIPYALVREGWRPGSRDVFPGPPPA